MIRRMAALCIAFFVALLGTVPVFARTGSLTVILSSGGTPIPGGTVSLYLVASREGEEMVTASEFSCWDGELTAGSARELIQLALAMQLKAVKQSVDQNGRAVFEDLPQGIYLLAQEEPAQGWEPICPFFVSIPYASNGQWVYDVVAKPKAEPQPQEPGNPETGETGLVLPYLALGAMTGMLSIKKYKGQR